MPGPVLFARYAYPPNALGYCGPGDPATLLGMASEGVDLDGLSQKATQFEGAWPYLELIAGCNDIREPLDRRVVEAYWTGNELVTRVPTSALIASLDDRFARRAGQLLAPVTAAAPGGVPQHNFHVFAVYPWLGLLRAGMEGPPLRVLDRCRIRWGCIQAITGELRDGSQPATLLRRLAPRPRGRADRERPEQLLTGWPSPPTSNPATSSLFTGIGSVTGCRPRR